MAEMTTSQAVRAYETHPNVLIRLILLGKLEARKNADGRWLISKDSLECWNRRRVRRRSCANPQKQTEGSIQAP
jgi:hypothetical protein